MGAVHGPPSAETLRVAGRAYLAPSEYSMVVRHSEHLSARGLPVLSFRCRASKTSQRDLPSTHSRPMQEHAAN
ncbi:MAG: hypothetical protein ACI8X5_001261 [Planctomycetota bacterium]|jgi:hypothetical protein